MPDSARNRGPLGELLDYIETTRLATRPGHVDQDGGSAPRQHPSPSVVLDEFQQLWNHLRTDSQLRQSMAAVPEDAGPLHSSALLHRAMTLMQDVSPGYLQHFIAYVDALSCMEQLQVSGVAGAGTGTPGDTRKATAKPRSRKRS